MRGRSPVESSAEPALLILPLAEFSTDSVRIRLYQRLSGAKGSRHPNKETRGGQHEKPPQKNKRRRLPGMERSA